MLTMKRAILMMALFIPHCTFGMNYTEKQQRFGHAMCDVITGSIKHFNNNLSEYLALPETTINDSNDLSSGVDPVVVRKGNTFLQAALALGQCEIVKYLLEKGADIHVTKPEHNNTVKNLLHIACIYNRPEIIRFLVESGIDVNAVYEQEDANDLGGRKPASLKNVLLRNPLIDAVILDFPEVVTTLIKNGAHIILLQNDKSIINMFELAVELDSPNCADIMINSDKLGREQIEKAVVIAKGCGNKAVFCLLVEYLRQHKNLSGKITKLNTSLDSDCIQKILQFKGVLNDVPETCRIGNAGKHAVQDKQHAHGNVMGAISRGSLKDLHTKLATFLQFAGTDINTTITKSYSSDVLGWRQSCSFIRYAIALGRGELGKYLYKKCADIHEKIAMHNATYKTLLHCAVEHSRKNIVAVLPELGLDLNAFFDLGPAFTLAVSPQALKKPHLWNPLIVAIYNDHSHVVDELIKAGALVHIDNEHNYFDALQLAIELDCPLSAKTLLLSGKYPEVLKECLETKKQQEELEKKQSNE